MSPSSPLRARPKRRSRGFTLLEMMLVVVIIGLLVSIAVINLAGQSTVARKNTTKGTLQTVQSAVTSYFTTNGQYPASINVLVPSLLQKMPRDAWKHDLIYFLTPSDQTHPYALYSMGEDGQANTADDLSCWNVDE